MERCCQVLGEDRGITFLFGVVTGILMEIQFSTNWAAFSKYAGGVIGQTLAMAGTQSRLKWGVEKLAWLGNQPF